MSKRRLGWFERFVKTDPRVQRAYQALQERGRSEDEALDVIRDVFDRAYEALRTQPLDVETAFDRLVTPELERLAAGEEPGHGGSTV